MIDFKNSVIEIIKNLVKSLSEKEIEEMIEIPPSVDMGDYSFPCFKLSKELKKSPNLIAEELVNLIDNTNSVFSKVINVGPYINFYVKESNYAKEVFNEIKNKNKKYSSNDNNGKTIVIDYSSTNIAKPFHIGHIRSTLIGNSIKNIYKFLGYNTIGVNHLGDYGTQFGKIIAAYKLWGDDEKINKDPIKELLKLYVDYNEISKNDEKKLEIAREYFNKLENGEKESVALWNWFKDLSLEEFKKVYDKLSVTFDSYRGEAYHSKFIPEVIEELKEKNLLTESDGCMVVNLDKYNLPPAIILKSNNSSTYITRDIATAIRRQIDYKFNKNLYVVATQQNLHFQQLFAVLTEMGYSWAKDCVHIPFGMVSVKDDVLGKASKLSTREGNVIFLNDVLDKSVEKTLEIINERNSNLENKHEIARDVGIGAVIYQELFNTRIKDYVFDWDNVLNFDGETGPYIQYSVARANSILEKNNFLFNSDIDVNDYIENYDLNSEEISILKHIYKLNSTLLESAKKYEPSILARYTSELSKLFNKFYNTSQIMNQETNVKNFRLFLTYSTKTTLEICLFLLGINAPRKM